MYHIYETIIMSNSTLLHSLIYMLLKGLVIFQTSHNAIGSAATNVYHTAKHETMAL